MKWAAPPAQLAAGPAFSHDPRFPPLDDNDEAVGREVGPRADVLHETVVRREEQGARCTNKT